MVINNLIYVHKIGENGAVLTATLSDAAGVVDLSTYDVTLNVKKGTTLIVGDAPCDGTAEGVVTCEIEDAIFADLENLRAGDYDAEFKAVNGSTVLFFPKNKDNKRTYFTFEVQKALA